MEVKSIRECLNIVDDVIVETIGKYIGIPNIKNFMNFYERKSKVISSKIVLLYQMSLVK